MPRAIEDFFVGQIKLLLDLDWPPQDVAEQVGCSVRTVYRYTDEMYREPTGVARGRPAKYNQGDIAYLISLFDDTPDNTARELARLFQLGTGRSISKTTVNR